MYDDIATPVVSGRISEIGHIFSMETIPQPYLSSNPNFPYQPCVCVLTQREFSEQIQDPFCYNTVIKKRYDSIIYFIKFSSQLFNLFQSSYLLNNV